MAKTKQFRCQLITPDRAVLDVEATSVVLPAHDGQLGILQNRAPLVCKLGIGICRITTAAGTQSYFLGRRLCPHAAQPAGDPHARGANGQEVGPGSRAAPACRGSARKARDPASQEQRRRAIERARAQLRLVSA